MHARLDDLFKAVDAKEASVSAQRHPHKAKKPSALPWMASSPQLLVVDMFWRESLPRGTS